MSEARARMRALVFLRSVLPLVALVDAAHDQPALRAGRGGRRGAVAFEVDDPAGLLRSVLRFDPLPTVSPDGTPTLTLVWRDPAAMNRFFTGGFALPRVVPWSGLLHLSLLLETARLLSTLRVLEPPKPGARSPAPDERALRVKLILTLISSALCELHRCGHPGMRDLAEDSPERVYQWTVEGCEIGVWLRMAAGRVHCGTGLYPRRSPFVHFVFPGIDAAYDVLTATSSQMETYRGGAVRTYGSPEYTRKITLLMQDVDALLMEG